MRRVDVVSHDWGNGKSHLVGRYEYVNERSPVAELLLEKYGDGTYLQAIDCGAACPHSFSEPLAMTVTHAKPEADR